MSDADEEYADPADARLADALERVAHGAVVSVPSVLVERGLTVVFTALLTNGFSAGAYGLFVLARRCQHFLVSVCGGFGTGLSRYLPNADSDAERDLVATFGSLLTVAGAVVLGGALYLAAPTVGAIADKGAAFELYVRVFALALPATVVLQAAAGLLRGLEEVGALNLTQRVGFPALQLGVAGLGLATDSLLVVAVGAPLVAAAAGLAAVGWLGRERGLRPRLRGPDARALHRRYAEYTAPVLAGTVPTTIQRLGFYPLIAVLLTGTAGAVFAVGVLLGGLVRLPLVGINQFMPPVAAALHGEDHREALSRLYGATSRLVLVGVTGLSVPVVVFRVETMALFGETFVRYAYLLPAFVVAQWVACAAGSVGILLMMTDHQRALLVVNSAITAGLVVVSIPLTLEYGIAGVVASYLLMLTVNNVLEVAVLYRLEGLQPLTRAHAKPLLAAVPLTAVALAARALVPGAPGALVGSLLGLAVYAAALLWLGFAPAERRLVGALADRYRAAIP
ncbi:lipopolysaccharide biosynthesis protein [Halosegnis marinus]|uniref:Polysaccharide biosynthesis C-terminal domain-containing protein n=1 Tax=Halosegnis marinus TaxID=3034023 RepID=A0ABD5ZND2_9EURY|nr:lipopolysaccharide biosynthesis protein [Halosegnis sp. DT85]